MNVNQLARTAGLMGEPARAAMLLALLDGRALTAGELARAARVTPATASRHLEQLVDGALLERVVQGRHRYHRLASAEVARALEGLLALGGAPARPLHTGPRDDALRRARTCWDHLAGRLGVAIAAHLHDEQALVVGAETVHAGPRAAAVLARWGVDPAVPARPCMDWGERRLHLGGRLGAMLCTHCLAQGWLRRDASSRALAITPPGARAFERLLGRERWQAV